MSEVHSALSRAEWDEFFEVSSGGFVDETERVMKMNAIRRSMADAALNARRYDAAAALALYAQPGGFTWDDVDRLRQAADESGPDRRDHLRGTADRIAALLPPRR